MRDGSRPESRRAPNRDSRCFRGRAFCGAFVLLCVLFSFAAAQGQNAAALIAKGDQFDEQLKDEGSASSVICRRTGSSPTMWISSSALRGNIAT